MGSSWGMGRDLEGMGNSTDLKKKVEDWT